MSINGPKKRAPWGESLTKQSFKDSCDINKIVSRHQREGTFTHLAAHGGKYGDFAEFDFLEHQNTLIAGQQIFDELPAEIRKEFNQAPGEFFAYVNDPENRDRLPELLPGLAEPGRQNPVVDAAPARQAAAGGAQTTGTPAQGGSNPSNENAPETGATAPAAEPQAAPASTTT